MGDVVEDLGRAPTPVAARDGHTEGDVAPMDDRPATAGSADDREPLEPGMVPGIAEHLKRAERERRARPGGDTHEHPLPQRRLGGEGLVERHVGRPIGGRIPPGVEGLLRGWHQDRGVSGAGCR